MTTQAFTPPQRTLMGPGPSDVPPSVLAAMGQSLVGHLDPSFVAMMEEIKEMLRQVFLTENEMTFPVSGTGSAGMEFYLPISLSRATDHDELCSARIVASGA